MKALCTHIMLITWSNVCPLLPILPHSTPNSIPLVCFSQIRRTYSTNLNLITNALDFVKSGGPKWIVGGTIFEMWLGAL